MISHNRFKNADAYQVQFDPPSSFVDNLFHSVYQGPNTGNGVVNAVLCWPTAGLAAVFATYARFRLVFGRAPLSIRWGLERGYPVHRYYLECFLESHAETINGHCLEFGDRAYSSKFGQHRVTKCDILHVDHSNPDATIVADLSQPNEIASDTFDCIICTHVMHLVFDLQTFTRELYRILRPG